MGEMVVDDCVLSVELLYGFQQHLQLAVMDRQGRAVLVVDCAVAKLEQLTRQDGGGVGLHGILVHLQQHIPFHLVIGALGLAVQLHGNVVINQRGEV